MKCTCSAKPFATDVLEDVTNMSTSPVQHGNVVFDITICDGRFSWGAKEPLESLCCTAHSDALGLPGILRAP